MYGGKIQGLGGTAELGGILVVVVQGLGSIIKRTTRLNCNIFFTLQIRIS